MNNKIKDSFGNINKNIIITFEKEKCKDNFENVFLIEFKSTFDYKNWGIS